MIEAFLLPFLSTLLAELGDKTQLMIVCLSSKTKKRLALFAGAVLAFILADGLAVLLGTIAGGILHEAYVKLLAGIIFLLFGIITIIRRHDADKESCEIRHPLFSGFLLIFSAEMGDKSQIMAALFAAEYNPFLVLGGVVLAMSILSMAAILIGGLISRKLNRRTISIFAGAVFIIIGIYTLAEILI